MVWRALVVDDVPRRRFGGLSAALFGLGAAGVQEEPNRGAPPHLKQPWELHLPDPPPAPLLRLRAWFEDPATSKAEAAVRRAGRDLVPWWEDVAMEDWEVSWQAHFPVLHIDERLIIAPPWDPVPGAIIIEPGQGFGTGQHATTRQALTMLAGLSLPPGGTAIDVGMGSGILALAAVRLGMTAEGVDIDPIAVVDADQNAARNGLLATFSTTPAEELKGPYDVVLANLFAETLVEMAPTLARLTGSHLILAGILADREQAVLEAFRGHLTLVERAVDGEWVGHHWRRG